MGYDFLTNFGIIVDCKNFKLIDSITNQVAIAQPCNLILNISCNNLNISPRVQNMLDKYPNLILPNKSKSIETPKVFHRIETGSHPPVFSKPRQLSAAKFDIAREHFRKLQKAGIVSPSKSPWASPIHMAPTKSFSNKNDHTPKEEDYRTCGDYKNLNKISTPDRYPIPNINSLSSKLYGKKFYSKIDLKAAYNQVPIHPDDVYKTAVTTPFGLFQYNFMPFGLRGSSSTFQRMMDNLFADVKCIFIYLDDILIFSEDEESHLKDIEVVLKILSANDLKNSINKCIFNVQQIDFLGHNVSEQGIKPSDLKLNEINNFAQMNDSNP